ncbi:hypothetical protein TNCV_4189971 [Trichonephila clavipes]|nr:hypothetical protein TNCV_4189971 [Trichonephila clavipes]
MTVAELQQKLNLKTSSNIILIPQKRSFKRKYSQDKGGIEKLAWKLPDFIKRIGTMKQQVTKYDACASVGGACRFAWGLKNYIGGAAFGMDRREQYNMERGVEWRLLSRA